MRYKSLIAILLVFAALHFVAGPMLCNGYNTYAPQALGLRTSAGKISVDLLNRMITVTDFSLADPRDQSVNLIAAKTLMIHFRAIPLLSRKIRIREISLGHVMINAPDRDGIARALLPHIENAVMAVAQVIPAANAKKVIRTTDDLVMTASNAGYDVAYRVTRPEPLVICDELNMSDLSVEFGPRGRLSTPPPVDDIDITITSLTPDMTRCPRASSFKATGRFAERPDSFFSIDGAGRLLPRGGYQLDFAFALRNADLAYLWPHLLAMHEDPDLASLTINAGTADIKTDLHAKFGVTEQYTKADFKNVNIASADGYEGQPLAGENRSTIIDAINAVGTFSIEFTDNEHWKKAFTEVVMQGVRKLIRKTIAEKLLGV
ncbi:MAG TPA: hypothetical protein P5287_01345 [bacterium]|nr:hypothetical protein [bacterium]